MGTPISGTVTTPPPNNQSPKSDALPDTGHSAGRGVQSSTAKCYLGRALGYTVGAYLLFDNAFKLCSAAPNTTNYMPGNGTENGVGLTETGSMTELTKNTIKAGVGALAVLGVGLTIFCYDMVLGKRIYVNPYAEENNSKSVEVIPAEKTEEHAL